MDTLKILLGATIALLLAALGLSWKNLQNGSTPKEKSDQEVQIEQLKLQQAQLQLEIAKLSNPQAGAPSTQGQGSGSAMINSSTTTPPAPPAPTASEIEAAKEQLREIEEEKKKAAAEAAKLNNQETAFIEGRNAKYENRESEMRSRRMSMIQNATTMAKVREWVESPEAGSFAVVDILSPENVQPGAELVIRRNGGILGKLRIDELGGPDGTIANAVTKFTNAKPAQGDELIMEPPFVDSTDGKYAPADSTPPAGDPNAGPGH